MPNIKDKIKALKPFTVDSKSEFLTTNQGVRIADNQNSLKVGERGPTLLEDFILREKITHFDHERIPERAVHARGAAAHGYFQVYKSLARYTKANFLQKPGHKTPVFVRFSTVAGSRGSADTARDVRGFAVKFYTQEGIFDLVGNNMPVFFIQDAIKFPDLIHAVKPEPHNEIPQASSGHDTFWDFISLTPETTHMIMWVMSDRAFPRSYRMMEGFGVHTFRLINAKGEAHFVKFHWKPLLGVHSLIWDEAQIIAGKDPDFNRRDLWEVIDEGGVAEWEFGMQIIPEKDEHKFDFDLLDPTKLIPEEIVPVLRVGKLTLNRNPDNFFAETEQVAFHPGHIVPGIDFTNDPLLQGRLFSYTDTQLSRLGGPNFHEIPINRPICPFQNNQRDGMHRQTINVGKTAYDRNSLNKGYPIEAKISQQGFVSYAEKIDAQKIRVRSASFADHFSQATLFWNSQSSYEKEHIINAFLFELGKVEMIAIRERMIKTLTQVDAELATRVAEGLGLPKPKNFGSKKKNKAVSPALSMENTAKNSIATRSIAFMVGNGANKQSIIVMRKALEKAGAKVKIVSSYLRSVICSDGSKLAVDGTFVTMPSVVFDATYIPDGEQHILELQSGKEAFRFLWQTYHYCKPIAASGEAENFVDMLGIFERNYDPNNIPGLFTEKADKVAKMAKHFIIAIAQHRHCGR